MRQRWGTALVAGPCVILSLSLGSTWPLALLGAVLAAVAAAELAKLLDQQAGLVLMPCLAAYLGSAWPVAAARRDAYLDAILLSCAIGVALGAAAVWALRVRRESLILAVLASLWIAAPLVAIVVLHRAGSGALWAASPALMIVLPVWAGDTAAIFAGRAWGRRKLAPVISPLKTVEGAMAGMLASILVGGIVAPAVGYAPAFGLLCGAVAGLFGQLGDLLASALKRACGAKDSGTLFPGHGGALDRLDSILLAAVPVAALVYWLG